MGDTPPVRLSEIFRPMPKRTDAQLSADAADYLREATGLTLTMAHWGDSGGNGTIEWFAHSDQPGHVQCCVCGHVVELDPGERFDFSDPRLCEHAWPDGTPT